MSNKLLHLALLGHLLSSQACTPDRVLEEAELASEPTPQPVVTEPNDLRVDEAPTVPATLPPRRLSQLGAQQFSGPSAEPSLSFDGGVIVFGSGAAEMWSEPEPKALQIIRAEASTGELRVLSLSPDGAPANGGCRLPRISADGSTVAFVSTATNLVPGTRGGRSLYLLRSGRLTLIEEDSMSAGYRLSADGRFLVYESSQLDADGKSGDIDITLYDADRGTREKLNVDATGARLGGCHQPSLSADATWVSFRCGVEGADGWRSVNYLSNRLTRFNLELPTAENAALISADASTLLLSRLTDPWLSLGVLRRDELLEGRVSLTEACASSVGSLARPDCNLATLSHDGRLLAFRSQSVELDPSSSLLARGGVFVRDTRSGVTSRRLDANEALGAPTAAAESFALSGDGRFLVLSTSSSTLVANDTNESADVFLVRVPPL